MYAAIGGKGAAAYALQQRYFRALGAVGRNVKHRIISLPVKGLSHPVYARYGSSDLDVFEQIFVEREYECLKDISPVEWIIDCGANVGYSSIFLLERFPKAHVVAVEPDGGNYVMLEQNLKCYDGRASTIRSALWSHQTGLIVSQGGFRDGREWTVQVRECDVGEEATVYATDMNNLLISAGFPRVDLLKIDIEAAEAVVFSSDCESWLDYVCNIAIELHDDNCAATFFEALRAYRYDLDRSGELTICRDIRKVDRQ